MRTPVAALAALLALSACGDTVPDQPAQPRQAAIIRLPIVPGRPGAAYLDLAISGDPGDLVSVTSPQIGRIEMHESMTQGDMASMHALTRIPTHGLHSLSFSPGGRHLMLFDLIPNLHEGDAATLTFHFAGGRSESVAAHVARGGA
jgi:copper(I)-binding protein